MSGYFTVNYVSNNAEGYFYQLTKTNSRGSQIKAIRAHFQENTFPI